MRQTVKEQSTKKSREEMKKEILESYRSAAKRKRSKIKRENYENDPIINRLKEYM